MAEKVSLLGLPLVLFRSILEQLHKDSYEAFCNFRLVSRACRAHSEALVFRTLTLHDQTDGTKWMNRYLTKRLQDGNDAIVQHVRHLRIGPFSQRGNCPSAKALEGALRHFNSLQSFSWNVPFPIPALVLDRFHASWPTARLHVTNTARVHSAFTLDKRLLSSPQLHSLALTAFCNNCGEISGLSEIPTLRACLLAARRLKVLKLGAETLLAMSWDDWDVGPYNLQFQPGDAMPSLEELALPSAGYYLSADHCQRWKACMDWTQLRVLELKNAPRHLLAALTGSVPELRCLRFHMARDYWMRGMNDEVDLGVVSRFLSSISGLEEVDVQESGTAAFPKIWAGFIERHGHSLRKLSVRHHAKNYIYPSDIAAWSTSDFARLLEETPRLESLAKDAELEQDPGTEQRSLVWPQSTTAVLVQFRHLRYLHLTFLLNEHCPVFCSHSPRMVSINEHEALGAATSLFNEFMQVNPNCAMEELKLSFMHIYPDKEWHFTVKRKWNASPGQERFVVEKSFINADEETRAERWYPGA